MVGLCYPYKFVLCKQPAVVAGPPKPGGSAGRPAARSSAMTRASIHRHGPYDARLPPITKAVALRAEQAHLCLTASAIYPASDRAESAGVTLRQRVNYVP